MAQARFGFSGGFAGALDQMMGGPDARLKEYTASGALGADMDEAISRFGQGDDSGFNKLRANLAKLGVGPKTTAQIIKDHLTEQVAAMNQGELARQDRERQAVIAEISPRPAMERTTQAPPADLAQFGIGEAMRDKLSAMDEDEGGNPNEITEYRPAYAGREPNQSDILRMAGRKAFDSLSGSDDFLTIPEKKFQLGQSGEANAALADLRKTQTRIMEDPSAQVKKLEDLGIETGDSSRRDVGYTVGPRGVTIRNNPQRRATEAGNLIFNEVLETTGSREEATKAREDYERRISTARGSGSKQGALNVTQTPQYLQNQTAIEGAKAQGQALPPAIQTQVSALDLVTNTIGQIESNLSDEFLGPIKGTDPAFSTRRTFGSTLGSPLGEKEVIFRQSIKDANDQLLRARSGAAITEQEYNRLAGMLPKPTDEPQVFRAGLKRFKDQMNALRSEKLRLGTTPRNQLGSGQPGPKAIPRVIGIERVE